MNEDFKYLPIEDYAIVGDLHTASLIGKNASVDFLCLPDFDSPSIFARLLDYKKGGYFQIAPLFNLDTSIKSSQSYLTDTNILVTRFLNKDSTVEISDFMPISNTFLPGTLIRRVKGLQGRLRMRAKCLPCFCYGQSEHKMERNENGYFFISQGSDKKVLRFYSELECLLSNDALSVEFDVGINDTFYFVLQIIEKSQESFSKITRERLERAFLDTSNYWKNWISQSTYQGKWKSFVHRSILTLKLLTSQKYSSTVAAPTFALPEHLGGERNWDYRYTWIRDASLTLSTFLKMGFREEVRDFLNWIEERCHDLNPDGSLQIMYRIDGSKNLEEKILNHWEGYRESRPVRIGNGAYRQWQLDIYGELMDLIYLYDEVEGPISHSLWEALQKLLTWLCENWKNKDASIWEIRGAPQEFLYSRLMSWVALDRGIRLVQKRALPAPLRKWQKVRDHISQEIKESFWNEKIQSYVQYKGSEALDVSSLRMALMNFIGFQEPRFLSTLRAIEKNLLEDAKMYRYRIENCASDGLLGREGFFTMCSFWYSECLACSGDIDKAHVIFEKILSYANHVGLYAEELGSSGEHLGNFPQALSHLALINTAIQLNVEVKNRK